MPKFEPKYSRQALLRSANIWCMFPDGSYVLHLMSPVPLMGTVTKGRLVNGQQEYWFTPDARVLAGFRATFSVQECDLELHNRPTRDVIEEINRSLTAELRPVSETQLEDDLKSPGEQPEVESNVLPWPENRRIM